MAKDVTMIPSATDEGMTDGQIEKLADSFRAALRKNRLKVPSAVAQVVCGMDNIGMECFAVIHQRANQIRRSVRLVVNSVIEFTQQGATHLTFQDPKDNNPLVPGTYEFTFKKWVDSQDHRSVVGGYSMSRIAERMKAETGLQAALHLLENQQLIPKDLRHRLLIFGGTASGVDLACLRWNGSRWVLTWRSLEFTGRDLLVCIRKVD